MKTLQELLQGLDAQVEGSVLVPIRGIKVDSRLVEPQDLFVALPGTKEDGSVYISHAIQRGASAVVLQNPSKVKGATAVHVKEAVPALARLAAAFWDRPTEKLFVVGVTGTNGKTTVSYLLESIWKKAGRPCGVIGTVNYRYGHHTFQAPNTTPHAADLQQHLAAMITAGCQACVMEVSSHALALGRVKEILFDVGVFTNLTQDHLDFHKTVEAYAQTKQKLFSSLAPTAPTPSPSPLPPRGEGPPTNNSLLSWAGPVRGGRGIGEGGERSQNPKPFPRFAVVNADDPWSEFMAKSCQVRVVRFGLRSPAPYSVADVKLSAKGTTFHLCSPQGRAPVSLALIGEHNVANALAAAAVALESGLALEAVETGLAAVCGVPGRMERVESKHPFSVLVDYAHTEDALRHALSALRQLQPRKLIVVFGCGGDRDRTKRPLMGETAARLADWVVLTSDNPRSEDPALIALDVEVGLNRVGRGNYEKHLDRREAVVAALHRAHPGDMVLIAGKGHETYQILKDQTIPFDDREVARELLGESHNP